MSVGICSRVPQGVQRLVGNGNQYLSNFQIHCNNYGTGGIHRSTPASVGWLIKNGKTRTTLNGILHVPLRYGLGKPETKLNSQGQNDTEEPSTSAEINGHVVEEGDESPTSSTGPNDQNGHVDELEQKGLERKGKHKKEKRGNWFFSMRKPSLPGNTPLRFFLSLLVLNILLNVWPMQKSPAPGYLPPGRYVTIKLPFSDFLKSLKKNEISFIAIEGNHLKCKLKPDASAYGSFRIDIDKSAIWFDTVKPRDYRLPYDTLMSNGAMFTTIEKSIWGDLTNIMVCSYNSWFGYFFNVFADGVN